MKQLTVCIIILTTLIFSFPALAQTKVVVVPLSKCADGLVNCSGLCVDTENNPKYCGNCSTDCGDGNYCRNGTCKKEVAQPCGDDAECLTGKCTGNICVDVKFVFISSERYTGNLGGLSGADSKCQTLAQNAGLPGTYKAWLSDSTQNPESRFNQSPLDYVLVDGSIIANGWSDLTDGVLDGSINQTEDGTALTGHTWTNTKSNGTRVSTSPANSCNNWSSDSDALTTTTGFTSYYYDARWTNNLDSLDCYAYSVSVGYLYCFEQ